MESEQTKSSYLMPAAIVAAGFFVAAAIIYTNQGGTPSPSADTEAKNTVSAADVLKVRESDFVRGNPSAPVTIVEYSDFQCPFCAKFFNGTMNDVEQNYIKSGKAKFIYRDFAFLGKESIDAASAAKCAGEQGKFWDYHDYLFTHQSGENQGAFSVDNLKKFAVTLGLDGVKFSACVDGKRYEDAVKQNTTEGVALGVDGTPTIFVNGKKTVGAQSFATIQSLIEEALK